LEKRLLDSILCCFAFLQPRSENKNFLKIDKTMKTLMSTICACAISCIVVVALLQLMSVSNIGSHDRQLDLVSSAPWWQRQFGAKQSASNGQVSRLYDVERLQVRPRVMLYHNFMSDDECDALLDVAARRFVEEARLRAKLHDGNGSKRQEETGNHPVAQNDHFKSTDAKGSLTDGASAVHGVWIYNTSNVVGELVSRAAVAARLPVSHAEMLYVSRHVPGDKFASHCDWLRAVEDSAELLRGGQRAVTVVLMLESVAGSTHGGVLFPRAKPLLRVPCVRGNALLFHNLLPSGAVDERALHRTLSIDRGVQWMATLWFRASPVG
jgi:hypothetical protein